MGCGLRQLQRAIKCVAGWRNQVRGGAAGNPRLQMRCKTSDQRKPTRAERDQPVRQSVDMGAGQLHERDTRGIVKFGMLDRERCESAEIARPRFRREAYDRVRIAVELFEYGIEQRGPGHASVMSPQDPAQRLAAEPGTAALIRDGQSPAADAVVTSAKNRPTDGARPGDNHAAIAASMCADAGGMRICREYGAAEWMLPRARCRQVGRLARACQGQARDDPCQIASGKTGLLKALAGGGKHGGKAFVAAQPDVGRPCDALAQPAAGRRAQASAASGSTAVNPQK